MFTITAIEGLQTMESLDNGLKGKNDSTGFVWYRQDITLCVSDVDFHIGFRVRFIAVWKILKPH